MPSQYETKRYDFNLYYDGYDQLALSAYRLFRDKDGDLNAETQQDDTYFSRLMKLRQPLENFLLITPRGITIP